MTRTNTDNHERVNRDLDQKHRDQYPMGRINTILTDGKNIDDTYRLPVGTKIYEVTPEARILEIVGYEHSDDPDVVETYVLENTGDETLQMPWTDGLTLHELHKKNRMRLVELPIDS